MDLGGPLAAHHRSHEEERLAGIACFNPGRKGGDAVTSLHKHGLLVNAVEGVTEVKEERPSMTWEGGGLRMRMRF